MASSVTSNISLIVKLLFIIGMTSCLSDNEFGGENTFIKSFGNKIGAGGRVIKETDNGGYVVAGFGPIDAFTIQNGTHPDFEVLQSSPMLALFDRFGNEIWRRFYHIEFIRSECHERIRNQTLGLQQDSVFFKLNEAEFRDVIPLTDGRFMAIGRHFVSNSLNQPSFEFSFPFNEIPFIVILDENGVLQRHVQFDCTNEYREYRRLKDLGNGNVALSSTVTRFFETPNGGDGFSIAMITYDGDLLWERDYGRGAALNGVETDACDLIVSNAGDLVVAGYVFNPQRTIESMVMKINSNGEIIKEALFGTDENWHAGSSISEIEDGHFALFQNLVPNNEPPPVSLAVTILDSELNEINTNIITDREMNRSITLDIIATSDGNLFLQSTLFDDFNKIDIGNPLVGFNLGLVYFKLDKNGEVIWRKPDPTGIEGLPRNMIPTRDGGVVTLKFAQFGTGNARTFLIKMNENGEITQ